MRQTYLISVTLLLLAYFTTTRPVHKIKKNHGQNKDMEVRKGLLSSNDYEESKPRPSPKGSRMLPKQFAFELGWSVETDWLFTLSFLSSN